MQIHPHARPANPTHCTLADMRILSSGIEQSYSLSFDAFSCLLSRFEDLAFVPVFASRPEDANFPLASSFSHVELK
ncbi:unnamed protein product [Protopolystoma xenopodis]|uniref:Uncharacterized protein n=1 Tax=Protopolystoma xenopodis TaxID=117903 RepID=A0A3S4ZLL9_9PLAT|nr:unnamed protein product [Protopolystoma xenopodis]